MYTNIVNAYPEARFAQANTAHDSVQTLFLGLSAASCTYGEGLAANLADISAANPDFRYYTAWGTSHCLTDVAGFTLSGQWRALSRLVADLVNGGDIASVACTDCTTPGITRLAAAGRRDQLSSPDSGAGGGPRARRPRRHSPRLFVGDITTAKRPRRKIA